MLVMEQHASAKATVSQSRPKVIIIGGGFAGVAAARGLKKAGVDILLIDRRNHYIFQPLLYQVATAVLSPSEVAGPLRQLAQGQANLSVLLAEATQIDLAAKTVRVVPAALAERTIAFDYLIIATGVRPTYFGHEEFEVFAPSLKTLADAEAIRARILGAYELAEQLEDPVARARALTIVLVGGGATGVELAASIAQMARVTLRSNFRRINPADTTLVLLEGAPRILSAFHESLSGKATEHLKSLGVSVRTGVMVESVDAEGVVVAGQRIESSTVLWTAGVQASSIVRGLGVTTDRAGRACVTDRLELPHNPNVFALGDAAAVTIGQRSLPGVAQVAIQEGRYAARAIAARVEGRRLPQPFQYSDRGSMAVVGKNFAILERGRLRSSGFLTWLVWVCIHILFLPQVQNRVRVQTQWFWSYFSGQRSSRLIPEPRTPAAGGVPKRDSTTAATASA